MRIQIIDISVQGKSIGNIQNYAPLIHDILNAIVQGSLKGTTITAAIALTFRNLHVIIPSYFFLDTTCRCVIFKVSVKNNDNTCILFLL
jgi:hypothetical protein